MLEEDVTVTCPHCWEQIVLEFDLSVEGQTYVEDCPVCCAPMVISYVAEGGTLIHVSVDRE